MTVVLSDESTDGDERPNPKTKRGKTTPLKDKPRRQKEMFTDEQNAPIMVYFRKHVKETKAPTNTLCQQFLNTYPHIFAGRESKHIQDKVRGMQSKYCQDARQELNYKHLLYLCTLTNLDFSFVELVKVL